MNDKMNDKVNARSMAISAIGLILSKEVFSTEIINRDVANIPDPKDESLYRELVYGTVENLLYIDYILQKASSIKLNKLEKIVLNGLRLGIYELAFLRIEAYATVNEIVKIVKNKKGQKTGNFVNAVLRNISRNIDKYKEIDKTNKLKYLSIRYSFNIEIVRYLSSNYNLLELEEIIKALSRRPKMAIRVNTNKISIEDFRSLLSEEGISTYLSKLSDQALIVENPFRITSLDAFKDGLFTIQDQSSIKVGQVLNPSEDSCVLDICAAPGSKTSHLAQISNDKSTIYANDISKDKLYKIDDNLNRMGFKNYKITNFDATILQEDLIDKFDYVLVDAPCSGLGVIMRKPEIKLFRTMKEIRDLANIQEQILMNACEYLKNNGTLVYSTCTLGIIENDNIINKILKNKSDLKLIDLDDKKFIKILPHIYDSDGFFIAKFTKH